MAQQNMDIHADSPDVEKILVVDDEASIRRILETRLKMVGLGHRRRQSGRGVPFLTPNSSSFGGVKF